MKHTQPQLFSEQCDKFMYSKPDSTLKNVLAGPQKNFLSELKDSVGKVFPKILSMEAFLSFAFKKVESWNKFCVFAIRVDDSETVRNREKKEFNFDVLVDIGKIVEGICINKDGFWGLPESGLLGCFFPEMSESDGLKTAKDIQEQVKALGSITISAGVAAWPFFLFEKKQILTNAKKALDHALFFGPSSAVCFDAVSLNINGDNLYKRGDIDGAIKEFKTALLIDSKNVNVRNSLGVCYGVKKEYEKALALFKKLIQLAPKDIMAIYNAGLVSLKMKKKEQALKFFLEAENIDKNHFEVLFQAGRLLLELKKYQKARRYLEKAVALSPESGPAQRFLGKCYIRLNIIEEAICAYSKAVKLNPSDASSLSALGFLYLEKGENQEIATLFCRQSVLLSPRTAFFRHRLGKVHLRCCRLEDAMAEFKKAVKLGHDSRKYIEEIKRRLTEDAK